MANDNKLFEYLTIFNLPDTTTVTEKQKKLNVFIEELYRWNDVYSFTSVDKKQSWLLHLVDSLAVAPLLPATEPIVDIGTGPGLPGIPLAILRPMQHFFLVDINLKRIVFLEQLIQKLQINNVTIVRADIVKYNKVALGNIAITRAFWPLSKMLPALFSTNILQHPKTIFCMQSKKWSEQVTTDINNNYVIEPIKLTITELTRYCLKVSLK